MPTKTPLDFWRYFVRGSIAERRSVLGVPEDEGGCEERRRIFDELVAGLKEGDSVVTRREPQMVVINSIPNCQNDDQVIILANGCVLVNSRELKGEIVDEYLRGIPRGNILAAAMDYLASVKDADVEVVKAEYVTEVTDADLRRAGLK